MASDDDERASSAVRLTGQRVRQDPAEAATVRRHLALHVTLARAEPGCVSFEARQTDDPLGWDVHEQFVDSAALFALQARTSDSTWGQATRGF